MDSSRMVANERQANLAFDELLASAAPMIGDEVSGLLSKGKPLSRIGGLVERGANGAVLGLVLDRADLARRVLLDRRLSPLSLAMLLEGLRGAGSDELPILLLIDGGSLGLAVTVRRIRPCRARLGPS
jgi:hypothetical protein